MATLEVESIFIQSTWCTADAAAVAVTGGTRMEPRRYSTRPPIRRTDSNRAGAVSLRFSTYAPGRPPFSPFQRAVGALCGAAPGGGRQRPSAPPERAARDLHARRRDVRLGARQPRRASPRDPHPATRG